MLSPGALKPPKGANPHAIELWFKACQRLPDNTRSARAQALRTYVSLCDSAGLSPFSDSDTDPNIAIRLFLSRRRRLYVRYLDITGVMTPVRIRKIYRDAYLTDYGFAIRIEGWVSVKDPLWFREIQKPGWRFSLNRDREHRYTVKLDPGITIYVRNPNIQNPNSWFVGYEIHCPLTPKLPDFKTQTLLKTLWDNTATIIRPTGTQPQRRL